MRSRSARSASPGRRLTPLSAQVEQWRRHDRGDDRDRDNHRVHRGREHAEAEPQQGEDDFHPAARVHSEGDRQSLAELEPSEFAAQKRTRDFRRARDPEHDQRDVRAAERREIGLQARVSEEHRRHQAHRDRFDLGAVARAHARRAAQHQSRDERAEHRVQANRLSNDRADERDQHHRAELSMLGGAAIVHPSHQPRRPAARRRNSRTR